MNRKAQTKARSRKKAKAWLNLLGRTILAYPQLVIFYTQLGKNISTKLKFEKSKSKDTNNYVFVCDTNS